MDHIETDKAFDEKFAYVLQREAHLETYFILVGQKDNIPAGKDEVKDFIHHRIELEVEKAVKAHAYKIKSILEKENYSNDACIYEIIKDIDSLNK